MALVASHASLEMRLLFVYACFMAEAAQWGAAVAQPMKPFLRSLPAQCADRSA
ncbi:hypothetical protein D3C78_1159340 [compost metagenome]